MKESRAPETASGAAEARRPGARDDGALCLEAMAGRASDPALAARVDAVLDNLCQRRIPRLERAEAVSAFRKFTVTLGTPANSANLLEAFVVADAYGVPAERVASFLKALPSPLAARFSPYEAALCLSRKPAADPRDVADAWSMGWEASDGGRLGDGDLAKMLGELAGMEGYRSLRACRELAVDVGNARVRPADSPNLLRGLLAFAASRGAVPTDAEGWERIAESYAAGVREFLAGDRAPRAAFVLGPSAPRDDAANAFKKGLPALEETLRDACVGGTVVRASDKADLLRRATKFRDENPGAPFFMSVALHGKPSGGALHSGGDLTPQDFQELAALSPDATLHLHSCYAGASLPAAGRAAVLLDSTESRAYTAILGALRDASRDPANDLNGDGKVGPREARLAVFLRWRKSFLPLTFLGSGGAAVRLAAQEGPHDAPQA